LATTMALNLPRIPVQSWAKEGDPASDPSRFILMHSMPPTLGKETTSPHGTALNRGRCFTRAQSTDRDKLVALFLWRATFNSAISQRS
jgi:hypothetical protein